MAKKAKPVVAGAIVTEYHVYDNSAEEIGGSRVVVRSDGSRVVRLNASQAQVLIEQGVVGNVPFESLSPEGQEARRQFRRRAV